MVTEKEWWVEQDQNIKQNIIFESGSCIKYFHSMILEIPCNMEISCILFFSKAYFCLLNAVFVCFLIHTFVLQLSYAFCIPLLWKIGDSLPELLFCPPKTFDDIFCPLKRCKWVTKAYTELHQTAEMEHFF